LIIFILSQTYHLASLFSYLALMASFITTRFFNALSSGILAAAVKDGTTSISTLKGH